MAQVLNDYNNPNYIALRKQLEFNGRFNGAWYYSHTICDKIAPLIKTKRTIDSIGKQTCGCEDGAIVFIHANTGVEDNYAWLSRYKDLILVSNNDATTEILSKMFPQSHAITVPVSVDVEEVLTHNHEKEYEACYAGNLWGFKLEDVKKYVPEEVPKFSNIPRYDLLEIISRYKNVYAVGITAVEAKVLGCNILVCDHRFPDPEYWQPLDYKDAAKILQAKIDEIDKNE